LVLIVMVIKLLRRFTLVWKKKVVVGVGRMSKKRGIVNLQSVV
jgi:hypothetical protein